MKLFLSLIVVKFLTEKYVKPPRNGGKFAILSYFYHTTNLDQLVNCIVGGVHLNTNGNDPIFVALRKDVG